MQGRDTMDKIVECVPNFSEGRDMTVIKQITDAIEAVEGVMLLDVDPGADTNRTVVTFVGSPEAVKEAAFQAVKRAAEVIDMSKHHGAHPRMGATDVCPFVPVSGVTMEDCVAIAREVGRRVGEELHIPVYLYEEAATKEEWRNLAEVRKGEYEGLKERFESGDPYWTPDFGPAEFNEKAGATAVGAREFLIAYNINLNTKDRKLAHNVALNLREKGRAKRDEDGKIVRDENGKKVMVPGRLKYTKAIGWYIEEYGFAQISINLTNYKKTPWHTVFEVAREEAEKAGLIVTGSELVGLIPKQAVLDAGRYFLRKQGKSSGVSERELIEEAVLSMGLSQIAPFDPNEKIIEYRIREEEPLVSMGIREFMDELASDSPAPGGGSVAALEASLGAALSSMVANLTVGKKGYEDVREEMIEVAEEAQDMKDRFLYLIDEDTRSFNRLMAAMKMPKKTEEEKEARQEAIDAATMDAARVPLRVAELAAEAFDLARVVAQRGNVNSVSDAGVAALSLRAAVHGACLNVEINLSGLPDSEEKASMLERVSELRSVSDRAEQEILTTVKEKL